MSITWPLNISIEVIDRIFDILDFKSIIFDFFGGLGRNFNANDDGSYAYPRVGVSIGKRF